MSARVYVYVYVFTDALDPFEIQGLMAIR